MRTAKPITSGPSAASSPRVNLPWCARVAGMSYQSRAARSYPASSYASPARSWKNVELFLKWWAPIWAMVTTAGVVVLALMQKTYAKRDDIVALNTRVESLQSLLKNLPTQSELHSLQLEVSELRGDLKVFSPQIQTLQKFQDMLIENEVEKSKK